MDYYSDSSLPNSPVLTDEELQRVVRFIDERVDAAELRDRGMPNGGFFDWESDDEDDDSDTDSTCSTDIYGLDDDDETCSVLTESSDESDTESESSGSTESAIMIDPDLDLENERDAELLAINGPSYSLAATTAIRPRTVMREIHGLGFATLDRFLDFIHRREIRSIFQELWDDFLSRMSPGRELPTGHDRYAYISHGIFRCWQNPGQNRYEVANPDKTNWNLNDHMIRFAMKLGPLCNGEMAGLRNNRESLVWAWAALELARVLRRMQKGFPGRSLYLQAVGARRERRTVRWAV